MKVITWEKLREVCQLLKCWGSVDAIDSLVTLSDYENKLIDNKQFWVNNSLIRDIYCYDCPDNTKQINPDGEVVE